MPIERPRRAPVPLLAGSAALNSGFIAFGFFSLREYVISPTLQGLGPSTEEPSGRLSWTDLRKRHVLDSSIAGAMVGAAVNAFKRGAAGMPAGAITAGIACSLAQVLVNEANIQRVKYASSFSTFSPPRESLSSNSEFWSEDGSTATDLQRTLPAVPEPTQRKSFLDHVLRLVGVTRLTDEEYLQKLKVQRERVLKRIQDLEDEKREALMSGNTSEDKPDNS